MNAFKFLGIFAILLGCFVLIIKVHYSTVFSFLTIVDYWYLTIPIGVMLLGAYLLGRGYNKK